MRAHPKSAIEWRPLFIQATVEHVRGELLGVEDDSEDFVKRSLVVAINAF
jgi:hypothetical protein